MLPSGDHEWLRPLYYPRQKVARARELTSDLKQEFLAIVANNPFLNGLAMPPGPVFDFGAGFPRDAEPPDHFIQDHLAPPARAAMLLGDILHNLRSSLDLLACELVEKYEGGGNTETPVDVSGVAFPFPRSELTQEAEITKKGFHRAGPEAVDIFRTLTPWEHGNRDMWALNQLNIIDKHRMVIPSTGQMVMKGEIRVRPDGSHYQVPLSQEVTFTLPKGAPLGGEPLPSTIIRLADLCHETIERFAELPFLNHGLQAGRSFR